MIEMRRRGISQSGYVNLLIKPLHAPHLGLIDMVEDQILVGDKSFEQVSDRRYALLRPEHVGRARLLVDACTY